VLIVGTSPSLLSYPGLKLLCANLKKHAPDVLDEIDVHLDFIILKAKTGDTLRVDRGRNDLGLARTDCAVRPDHISQDGLRGLTAVERFLALHRLILAGIARGQTYQNILLEQDRAAFQALARADTHFKLNVDGFPVIPGVVTLDHYFRPRGRRLVRARQQRGRHTGHAESSYFKPLTPDVWVFQKVGARLNEGHTLSPHTYWHFLGVPDYAVSPQRVLSVLRPLAAAHGRLKVVDYSVVQQRPPVETAAHLMGWAYVPRDGAPQLACPARDGFEVPVLAAETAWQLGLSLKAFRPQRVWVLSRRLRGLARELSLVGGYRVDESCEARGRYLPIVVDA
jgi:hypothetical protein